MGGKKLGVGLTTGVRPWGWRATVLAALVVVALLGLSSNDAAKAQPSGQGVFSLDKQEYVTVEGQAVFVTVKRTDGGILTSDIQVQLALERGTTGFDWPASDEVKLVTFSAGTNPTQMSVYIQTLNQNQFDEREIWVTIRSISNGGLMGPVFTSPIKLLGNNQPRITSISPHSVGAAPQPVSGYPIEISGFNFATSFSAFNDLRFRPVGGGADVVPIPAAVSINYISPERITLRIHETCPVTTLFTNGQQYHILVRVLDTDTDPHLSMPSTFEKLDVFTFTCGPTVTAVTPARGPAAGGNTVRIHGTGFTGATGELCTVQGIVVTFGFEEVLTCRFAGPTILEVTPPPKPASPDPEVIVPVRVNVPGFTPTISPPTPDNEYTYDQGPVVTSISPNFGPPTGGTVVEIFGSNFAGIDVVPGSSVKFGGIDALSYTVHPGGTRITAVSPVHSGIQQITVTHGQSGSSPFTTAANFTYSTGPLIEKIDPPFGPVTGGTVVTITGTGFAPGATVRFGQTAAQFVTVKSQTQLEVVSPPGTGNQIIRVTVNGVTSPDTPLASFAYSGPVVTSISPIAGPVAGGTAITIKGQNFTSQSTVQFGPLLSATPTFVDTQTLTVTSPPSGVEQEVHIRVTTGSGQSPETPASLFTYTNGPIIDQLNPATGPTTGGTIVIITGKNFTAPLTVAFGSTPAPSFNINSATQITVLSPSHGVAEAVDVRVTKGSNTSPVGAATKFTYASAVPIVTQLAPNQGSTVGGYDVVITGLGFTGATCPGAVKFGAMPAPSCTVINDTTLSVKAPPNVSGSTVVSVTTPNGTSALSENFTYVSPSGSGGSTSPPAPSPVGTETYVLTFRWTLLSWGGLDNTPVENAIRGSGTPGAVDLSHRVTAIFEWDATTQAWKAYFPGATGVPGAADFTTFKMGAVYWVAINGEGTLNWVIPAEQ